MASGDTLATLYPEGSRPTGTLYATHDFIVDASTPTSTTPVLDFDGSAQDEHAEWDVELPSHYGGGSINFVIKYAMSGTDADAVQFEIRGVKLVDTSDLDSDLGMDTATAVDVTDTPTGTANAMMVCTAGNLTAANLGTPTAGDKLRIRVTRDYDHAANTDDAQLVSVTMTEGS